VALRTQALRDRLQSRVVDVDERPAQVRDPAVRRGVVADVGDRVGVDAQSLRDRLERVRVGLPPPTPHARHGRVERLPIEVGPDQCAGDEFGDRTVREEPDRSPIGRGGDGVDRAGAGPDVGVERGDDRAAGGVPRGVDATGAQRRGDVRRQRDLRARGGVDVCLPERRCPVVGHGDPAGRQRRPDGRRRRFGAVGIDECPEEVERDYHDRWVGERGLDTVGYPSGTLTGCPG